MKLSNKQIALILVLFINFLINYATATKVLSLFSDESWAKLKSRNYLRNFKTIKRAGREAENNAPSNSTSASNTTPDKNTSSSQMVKVNFDDATHQLALFYNSFFGGLSFTAYKVLFNISKEWIDCSNNYDFQTEYQKNVFNLRVLDIVDPRTRAIDNRKVQTLLGGSLNALFDTIVKKTYDNPSCSSLKALIDKTNPVASKYLKSWSKVVKEVNGNTLQVKFPAMAIANENLIAAGYIQLKSVPIGIYVRKSITFMMTPYDRVGGFLGNIAGTLARTLIKK